MKSYSESKKDNYEIEEPHFNFEVSKRILQNRLTGTNFHPKDSRTFLPLAREQLQDKTPTKQPPSHDQQHRQRGKRSQTNNLLLLSTTQNCFSSLSSSYAGHENTAEASRSLSQTNALSPQSQKSQNQTFGQFYTSSHSTTATVPQVERNKRGRFQLTHLSDSNNIPDEFKQKFFGETQTNAKAFGDNLANSREYYSSAGFTTKADKIRQYQQKSKSERDSNYLDSTSAGQGLSREEFFGLGSLTNPPMDYVLGGEQTNQTPKKESSQLNKTQTILQKRDKTELDQSFQLRKYLNHLSRDFQNDSSSKRVFMSGHLKHVEENRKIFIQGLQVEFDENKKSRVSKIIPKLQMYAKMIQNCANLKNSMDKKYLKTKKEENKKKQLLEYGRKIDLKYLNYEVTLHNFCNNMQQFAQSHQKNTSVTIIKKINGYNDKIRALVIDEMTGQLRSDFAPKYINWILSHLTTAENKGKDSCGQVLPLTINKRNSQMASMNPNRRAACTNEISPYLVKMLFQFNKSLEDHNNEELTEQRNKEVMNAAKEAKIIEEKLYNSMLSNRVNNTDKLGIFSELKKGIIYQNGNPTYASSIPISDSINQGEKKGGKFEHILHRNRYQSKCIDQICQSFKLM